MDTGERRGWDERREQGETSGESKVKTYTLPRAKQTARGVCSKSANWGSVTAWRGGMGWEVGGRFRREGTYVCLQLSLVAVWQKPTQYCKTMIFQLKVLLKLKN